MKHGAHTECETLKVENRFKLCKRQLNDITIIIFFSKKS